MVLICSIVSFVTLFRWNFFIESKNTIFIIFWKYILRVVHFSWSEKPFTVFIVAPKILSNYGNNIQSQHYHSFRFSSNIWAEISIPTSKAAQKSGKKFCL